MVTVFMTHSKSDLRGRTFFDKLFSSSDHKAYWYSWEGPDPPHAQTILNAIRKSASVFVLLSNSMENAHTRAWVSYEVGVASALNKNVWVFEPSGMGPIDVPVPYLTGYIQYPEEIEKRNIFPYLNLVSSAGLVIPQDPDVNNPPFFIDSECAYEDCKAPFYRYVLEDRIAPLYRYEVVNDFFCPVCRRGLTGVPLQ